MIVTKDNYKTLKDQVEGHRLDLLDLNQTYVALCYLTHRRAEEQGTARDWTSIQIYTVKQRQRKLLAERGIYVLTAA